MFRRFLYKKPQSFAPLKLRQFREAIHRDNLHDTFQLADSSQFPKPPKPAADLHLRTRTVDGSYSDLEHPEMSMSGIRFGRNVLLAAPYPDEQTLPILNPLLLIRRLMTREEFKPPTIVNLPAAAWIQFQNQHWMTHGGNQPNNKSIFRLRVTMIGRKKIDRWRQNIQLIANKSIDKNILQPLSGVLSIV